MCGLSRADIQKQTPGVSHSGVAKKAYSFSLICNIFLQDDYRVMAGDLSGTHFPIPFGNDRCGLLNKVVEMLDIATKQSRATHYWASVRSISTCPFLPNINQGCFWPILYTQMDSPLMCSQGMEMIY